jgi:hypothetical protein
MVIAYRKPIWYCYISAGHGGALHNSSFLLKTNGCGHFYCFVQNHQVICQVSHERYWSYYAKCPMIHLTWISMSSSSPWRRSRKAFNTYISFNGRRFGKSYSDFNEWIKQINLIWRHISKSLRYQIYIWANYNLMQLIKSSSSYRILCSWKHEWHFFPWAKKNP